MFFKKSNDVGRPSEGVPAIFWGASDRMICCKGIGGESNEFNTTSHPKLAQFGYIATLEIQAPDEAPGVLIHAFYSGHWSFAVSPASDDADDMPDWKVTRAWGTVNQHSETLIIDCPKGCKIRVVSRIVDEPTHGAQAE